MTAGRSLDRLLTASRGLVKSGRSEGLVITRSLAEDPLSDDHCFSACILYYSAPAVLFLCKLYWRLKPGRDVWSLGESGLPATVVWFFPLELSS